MEWYRIPYDKTVRNKPNPRKPMLHTSEYQHEPFVVPKPVKAPPQIRHWGDLEFFEIFRAGHTQKDICV